MLLTVVGCSGSVSGPASAASCYLVQAPYAGPTFSLLLDLGPGALGALYHYLEPERIGAVGLSHLHPDHCLDLCGLYVAAAYSPARAVGAHPRLRAVGHRPARIARAYEAPPPQRARRDRREPAQLAERFAFRDWAARADRRSVHRADDRGRHPTPAYAVRVTETANGASARLLRRHRADPGAGRPGDGGGSAAHRVVLSGPTRQPARPAPVRSAGRPDRHRGRGSRTLVLTHIPPWHDPRARPRRGATALRRAACAGRVRGAVEHRSRRRPAANLTR